MSYSGQGCVDVIYRTEALWTSMGLVILVPCFHFSCSLEGWQKYEKTYGCKGEKGLSKLKVQWKAQSKQNNFHLYTCLHIFTIYIFILFLALKIVVCFYSSFSNPNILFFLIRLYNWLWYLRSFKMWNFRMDECMLFQSLQHRVLHIHNDDRRLFHTLELTKKVNRKWKWGV